MVPRAPLNPPVETPRVPEHLMPRPCACGCKKLVYYRGRGRPRLYYSQRCRDRVYAREKWTEVDKAARRAGVSRYQFIREAAMKAARRTRAA